MDYYLILKEISGGPLMKKPDNILRKWPKHPSKSQKYPEINFPIINSYLAWMVHIYAINERNFEIDRVKYVYSDVGLVTFSIHFSKLHSKTVFDCAFNRGTFV